MMKEEKTVNPNCPSLLFPEYRLTETEEYPSIRLPACAILRATAGVRHGGTYYNMKMKYVHETLCLSKQCPMGRSYCLSSSKEKN